MSGGAVAVAVERGYRGATRFRRQRELRRVRLIVEGAAYHHSAHFGIFIPGPSDGVLIHNGLGERLDLTPKVSTPRERTNYCAHHAPGKAVHHAFHVIVESQPVAERSAEVYRFPGILLGEKREQVWHYR